MNILKSNHVVISSVLKVWMDGHGRRPGTYFQYVLAEIYYRSSMHYFFHTLSTGYHNVIELSSDRSFCLNHTSRQNSQQVKFEISCYHPTF